MIITCWGVRGSIPSPGPATARYGGNTTCISVELAPDKIMILDAGTGIRHLGKQLIQDDREIYVILSHSHWDHIQGFPFFLPLYQPNRKLYLISDVRDDERMSVVDTQMDGTHFPVMSGDLPSDFTYINNDGLDFLKKHGFNISRIATNHPGGCFGYRLEHNGHTAVYISDNELDPPYPKTTKFDEFVKFCKDADLLIHNAQFLEEDMPLKHGWGHSLVSQACNLAAAAQVKQLLLFHHEPDRSDEDLDKIQVWARNWFSQQGATVQCTVAHEGLSVKL